MNKNDLLEAMQDIDKDLINEAKPKKKISGKKITAIASSALCIVLAVVLGVSFLGGRNSMPERKSEDGTYGTYKDGIIGEKRKSKDSEGILSFYSKSDDMVAEGSKGGIYDAVPGGREPSLMPPGGDHGIKTGSDGIISGIDEYSGMQISSGMLTAGEWSDIRNYEKWADYVGQNGWNRYAEERKLNTLNSVNVNVSNSGNPCVNISVFLLEGNNIIYKGVSDVNGNVRLFYNIVPSSQNKEKPDGVMIGDRKYGLSESGTTQIELDRGGSEVQELDLMLMVDTTGSMGDELEYLKCELADMVRRIGKAADNLSIRVSVNFYRDEGDEYIVKYFDFRGDIDECVSQIKAQYAEGGGDYPEAVHTALENAVNGHEWRENAVKLCFLVYDAPAHTESEIQGINSQIYKTLCDASEKGVRIIPVLCSVNDKENEFLSRTYALLTGGTYIFLTNDSGIGGEHMEPTVGEYKVEKLNDCLVRVACEFCGIKE